MLALTPTPLTTAGERALFGELARWDTGGSVKSAVVASIPLVDGPLQRRLSDAVLFVPEGIVVVRIAEVTRQSGVVTASPEGAWTIGPAGQPGEVLQLQGGGSTPLDGLMRAGMDVAVRLRTAGLEPGRIGRLTVLVGEVTGLVPADGDLGEGDHVCLLDTRSLLLGIARATRYAGVDNPRVWTTADVRAGLEALGLEGRGPVVEELNGEGFPYSPYVLRRPGLMAPAAMAVMADSMDAPAAAPEPVQAAAPAPAAPPPAAPVAPQSPTRDTVAIDEPDLPAADDGGIGGLFARSVQDSGPVGPPRTAVFDTPGGGAPAGPPALPPPSAGPSWGSAPPVHESTSPRAATAAPGAKAAPDAAARQNRRLLLMAVLAVLVVVLGVAAWLTSGGGSGNSGSGTAASSSAPAASGPKVGDVQKIGSTAFTVEAVAVDQNCAGHSYGQVGQSLQVTDCTGLSRALYSAQLPGGKIVVSVIRARMPDTVSARNLKALADRDSSGNINNLLREGVRYPGGPTRLANEEYDSAVSGTTVAIVEDAWVDPAAAGTSSSLDAMATTALALRTPPFPGP